MGMSISDMKKAAAGLAAAVLLSSASAAPAVPAATASYAGNEIRLYESPLSYEVTKDGVVLVKRSPIGLTVDGKDLAKSCACLRTETQNLSGALPTPIYKKAFVDLAGSETFATFDGFAVRLVARKDGVAYRFELPEGGVRTIDGEIASLTIASGAECAFNRNSRKRAGCEETLPEFSAAGDIDNGETRHIYLPFVFATGGFTVAATDSDTRDYPVWNLGDISRTQEGDVRFNAFFAKYPDVKERVEGWNKERVLEKGGRWLKVRTTKDWIAKVDGARSLPWRVFAIVAEPSKLAESDMVYALAAPAESGADFSWVKPGKVAWDWWNAFDNKGGGGLNTRNYMRFVDFAAANGIEYVILDEGWSVDLDIWKFNPDIDVPGIVEYGREKGVGIILWMAWAQLAGDEERVAAHFAKLGVKGFKVDFMDRGDAEVARFLEHCAAVCAKHGLLVDYHGVYRPTGLHRRYPNIVNYEAVHGLEQLKWARPDKDMTGNDVACFFLRMTAGPMDYTPGAMDNYPVGAYGGTGMNPGSVGTRCHQMALMTLYEAPLQMLCDSPTKYEKNMECFRFMAAVPTVWDETVSLGGTPRTMAAVARRARNGSWYAAGITCGEARDFFMDLSFLGGGEWRAEIFRDAPASDVKPREYIRELRRVRASDGPLAVRMAKGGGFAMHFTK